MTKSYVRTATRSTLKVEANPTQILNFKANFHTEFEPFFKKKIYANNGGHFNSLESTGDNGRQPPLLPPRPRATRVDTRIHNYRLSAAP